MSATSTPDGLAKPYASKLSSSTTDEAGTEESTWGECVVTMNCALGNARWSEGMTLR